MLRDLQAAHYSLDEPSVCFSPPSKQARPHNYLTTRLHQFAEAAADALRS